MDTATARIWWRGYQARVKEEFQTLRKPASECTRPEDLPAHIIWLSDYRDRKTRRGK